MTIKVDMYLFQNGNSADNGISFHFAQSGSTITFDGHIKPDRGDASGIEFNICHADFNWEKEPLTGPYTGSFASDGAAIAIFKNRNKTIVEPMDGTGDFHAPVISNRRKTLFVPNSNLTTNTYYYKLGISVDGVTTYFPLDPMIRNTGPRTFFDALIRPVLWILEAVWILLGRPYARNSPNVNSQND